MNLVADLPLFFSMLYHHRRTNDHPVFTLIKKRDTLEWLSEGQVSVTDNEISNNDIFPATLIFKPNTSFQLGHGDFVIGLCDSNNHYRNLLINRQHKTISSHFGQLTMGFDLPKIEEEDIISFTTDSTNMYLSINSEKHAVWDILEYDVENWLIYCYMDRGKMKYFSDPTTNN